MTAVTPKLHAGRIKSLAMLPLMLADLVKLLVRLPGLVPVPKPGGPHRQLMVGSAGGICPGEGQGGKDEI